MPGDSYAGIKPKGKIQFQLEDVGSWNVSGEFGQQTVSQPIIVSFPNETINVSLSFNESVLYVSSPLGAIITVSNGNETLTSVSTGQNSFTLYSFGNWTVSGQINGGNLTTSTVYVQPGNSYQVQLKIMAANLIVSGRENMQVTVTGEDFSKTEQIKNGNCVFQISQFGTYSITGVLGGLNATPMSVNVQSYQNYTISLQISVINIIVAAPEGAIITAKNGNNVLTASVQSGQATFVTQVIGLWEITGSLNGFSLSSSSLNISDYGNYHVELFILTATLTVTAPQGTLVTVQGGGEEQTLPATNGTATFQLSQLGKYSVSGSLNGLESDTQVIQIDQFQEYTLALTILYATITVFAPENTEITLTNGSKQLNGTATDGNTVFNVQATGNWTVSGILEGYTFADKTVNVTNIQGDYSTTLSPLYATITVTAPDETEVVAESASGEQVYGYVNGSSVELQVYRLGAWTVSGTQGNLTSNSVSVQVSDWTNYQVTLTIWVATITVTAPTGIQVTAENGATSLQQTAANNQTVFSVQQTGNWTLSAQFDTQSDSEVVDVQAEQDYPVRLWVPTIVPTVATGSVVTCTQGQTVLTKTSQNGQVRFYVPSLGEWTLNATLNQQSSNTVIIDVQEDRDYPLLLNYTFATITVSTLAGTEVTAQNGAIIITQTANSNGEAVFEVATFGTWTLSATINGEFLSSSVNVSQAINYDISLNPTPKGEIYGASWSGTSSPVWTRTDAASSLGNPNPAVNNGTGSSPFDDIMPWSGMTRVSDPVAGELVAIPKYWYKWTRSGASMQLQIANGPISGFYVSPAHADRGDGQGERDVVYVGRYHCASDYKSTTGVQPLGYITRATARENISALGAEYWQYDFAMYWTIMMLYLVEYANWNSQATIGYGCSPGGSKFNMGLTDDMQYHTGTSAASRMTYGCCQYRHIEGLWDNMYDWCDGIYFSGSTVYCIANPASFSDTSGGTNVGTRDTSGGYISGWTNPTASGFEYALYPNALVGSNTTYICDYCDYKASGVVCRVGGGYGKDQVCGAFRLSGNGTASSVSLPCGCRLQKLP